MTNKIGFKFDFMNAVQFAEQSEQKTQKKDSKLISIPKSRLVIID